MPTITFIREKITVDVPAGTTLRAAARKCGVPLYTFPFQLINCWGNGLCGECRLIVTEGGENLSPAEPRELEFPRPRAERTKQTHGVVLDDGERLACKARVLGDAAVWTRLRSAKPQPRASGATD